jgi:hypothetical protein
MLSLAVGTLVCLSLAYLKKELMFKSGDVKTQKKKEKRKTYPRLQLQVRYPSSSALPKESPRWQDISFIPHPLSIVL